MSHIGSFSKTISPTLRLGFLVAPPSLLSHCIEVAACLGPPPGPSTQLATAEFMRAGHYLRHLRLSKRTYAAQRDALECLQGHDTAAEITTAGLTALIRFSSGMPDVPVVREATAFGMSPVPLSAWYSSLEANQTGLLLGIATAPRKHIAASCQRLREIIARFK